MNYESFRTITSETCGGVQFRIHKISYRRRTALLEEVRALGPKLAYLQAGESVQDQIEAAILQNTMDEVYVRWGLAGIEGLQLDGAPADPDRLFAVGPEPLVAEIVRAIKAECGLTQAERKN